MVVISYILPSHSNEAMGFLFNPLERNKYYIKITLPFSHRPEQNIDCFIFALFKELLRIFKIL